MDGWMDRYPGLQGMHGFSLKWLCSLISHAMKGFASCFVNIFTTLFYLPMRQGN